MSAHAESMLTVVDLELMPDDLNRYELVEGEILVSRSPGLTHQDVLANLLTILINHLQIHPEGKAYLNPGVILDNHNSVIPDLAFVSGSRLKEIASGKHITGAPDLVIEIVSPGNENARRDRVLKRKVYGAYGVQEYWIVDPLDKCVEIYRLRENTLELLITFSQDEEITSPLLPNLVIPAYRIFDSHPAS
jgi:Uma2 family endonuclease